MRWFNIFLLVILAAVALRAAVDFYDLYYITNHNVSSAKKGIKDCEKIYSTVVFDDTVLQRKIIQACEERMNMSMRWIYFESLKAWISSMWICDNLHCSEYMFPIFDQIAAAFRYSALVTIAFLLLTVYYLLPAVVSYFLRRILPQPRFHDATQTEIDLSPKPQYILFSGSHPGYPN